MKDLIEKEFHAFYESLRTTTKAREFDELEDNAYSDPEDQSE